MALGRSRAVALIGLEGHLIEVEADIAAGLPAFTLVGLPDASLTEARDRVRAAAANAQCPLPPHRITVNLSPAALPKTGTSFDLAVAAALLAAAGRIPAEPVAATTHLGELGLDGRVRPVRGVLPAVLSSVRAGHARVVVPWANAAEARLVPGADVTAVGRLGDVVALHRDGRVPHDCEGPDPEPPYAADRSGPSRPHAGAKDLADVVGQPEARYALEVAAAGAHHLLLVGPPGAGKTMLAHRLPGLLPDLEDQQALEVTAVHSVAGTLNPSGGLLRRPPFEDPHHTASVASLVGGGSGLPRPGAASRAHRGVLFLDEAAEFQARSLDALRQPLEHGELVIHRALGTARYPARFQLVLAANPCPCGRATGTGRDCACTSGAKRRYFSRLSGPLLDRMDLQIVVNAVSRADMIAPDQAPESTALVAGRVAEARQVQRERLSGTPWVCNGDVPGAWLRGALRLPPGVTAEIDRAMDHGRLTVRGYDRTLRCAWTVADLAGRTTPGRDEVGRALALRDTRSSFL